MSDMNEMNTNRWLPVAGGVMMNLALGTFYAMSVFLLPLEKEFGWTRAQTSWVTTIGIVMIASWYVIAGWIHDRRGPRLVAAIGGTLFSLGLFLASYTSSLFMFYATAGVIAGTGSGFGYVVPTSVGSKWFPDKRGLIVGFMVGGYGAGSGIFGPIASSLIESYGWRGTFRILSVLFFAMTMIATYLVRNPPAGYRPAGWDPTKVKAASRQGADVMAGDMVLTQTFWALWIAYCLGTTAGTMVISQLVPFAKSVGVAAASLAAISLVIAAAGNASGRIFSGWMSDALGRLNVLRLMIGISAVSMFILPHTGAVFAVPILLYIMVFVVYWCYGTQLSVNASTTSDFWGTKNAGINYGLLFTSWGVAGIIGPRIGGKLFDKYKDYKAAFYVAGVLAIVALIFEMLAKKPEAPKQGA